MRLYKVNTTTIVTVETRRFWKKTQYECGFTAKTKYIYAKDENEAKKKYENIFFTPHEGEWTKHFLWLHQWSVEGRTPNMKFDLGFNQKILKVEETVYVSDSPVNVRIDVLRHNMTGDDFRDWLMNGNTHMNVDTFDEVFK